MVLLMKRRIGLRQLQCMSPFSIYLGPGAIDMLLLEFEKPQVSEVILRWKIGSHVELGRRF